MQSLYPKSLYQKGKHKIRNIVNDVKNRKSPRRSGNETNP